jgi:hypothetical protein
MKHRLSNRVIQQIIIPILRMLVRAKDLTELVASSPVMLSDVD